MTRPTSLARKPESSTRDWRVRLDAHISRCPGCDQWRWDDVCAACNPATDEVPARKVAA